VVHVCDLDRAKAEVWAGPLGARISTDWQAVIADPAVEAIVVATISRLHHPICLAAIAAGKAVICEKTLATNPDDALSIVHAAEARGTLLFTSYMKRWFEAAEQAHRLLPSLGRIVSTHARVHQPWGYAWTNPPAPSASGPSWCLANYGGGMLVMGGSHLLDLILYFLGRPQRVYGRLHVPAGSDIDVHASALMETAEHGTILFDALASTANRSGFLRDGWDEQIEIIGLQGKLTLFTSMWNQVEQKTALLIHDDDASGQRHEYRYAPDSPFERAIGRFVADIACGQQTCQTRHTGYDVDQVIASIGASAQSGQAVTIPWRS
jgi:predicted dehydrogenase